MPEQVKHHTISQDEAGQRLDNFLSRVLKKAPKPLIYKIIRKGEVRINKGRAKPERKLKAGDIVRIPPVRLDTPAIPRSPNQGLRMHLEAAILYEDEALMVVNKPAGLAVHGGSGIRLGLIEALRDMRPTCPLELVHRLDRDTSGCIVLAKKRSMLRYLHSLFRSDSGVDKRYLALVKGSWPRRRTRVDAPLKKNVRQSGERFVCVSTDGKPSTTLFSIQQRYEQATLVEARPITGRTHQIRVHALFVKHPLVGDEKYGDEAFNHNMKQLGFRRLFLHAAKITFALENGQVIALDAPLPEDLRGALDKLQLRNGTQSDE